MEKKLVNLSELIVDTSFLLPLAGIKVKGIENDLLDGKTIYYPSLMLTELIAVIIKEAKKLKLSQIPEDAMKGLSYIISNVRLISLGQQDLGIIYEIINNGWNDIFDATLYSAYKSTGVPLITMDKSFYEFLNRKGLDTNKIILI
ncbi:PIN domain-containing protein [Acidianus brierleyi]|uniref:PIN domain-containing protein n=1 Tax=Acidianus brierleyi TaxID=41673 RepID=A0A2U9II73_9CREN|nr:PIN domain-containing protein [Acidianus brierleyi]AWR95711.1 PIN domain-containing protein [Acidianus brierleyi]